MSLKSAFAVTVMAAAIAGHLDAQYAAMPYSLTMRSVVCCYHDGRRTLPAIGDYFVGQRGDGARVQIVPLPDGSRSWQLEFRAQGLSIQANDKNNYITTIGSGHGLVLPSDVTCRLYGGAKSDRTERLLGFKVLHVASTPVTNPDPNDYDEQDSETWYAPDLGCVVLKEVHWWKWNGQRTGQVTMVEAIKAEAKG